MWWLKPAFDRIPLYVLSRAVFGDVPTTRQTLHAQRQLGPALAAALPDLAPARPGALAVPAGRPARRRTRPRGRASAGARLGAPVYGVGALLTAGLRALRGRAVAWAPWRWRCCSSQANTWRNRRARLWSCCDAAADVAAAGACNAAGLAGDDADRTVLRRRRLRPVPQPPHRDRRPGTSRSVLRRLAHACQRAKCGAAAGARRCAAGLRGDARQRRRSDRRAGSRQKRAGKPPNGKRRSQRVTLPNSVRRARWSMTAACARRCERAYARSDGQPQAQGGALESRATKAKPAKRRDLGPAVAWRQRSPLIGEYGLWIAVRRAGAGPAADLAALAALVARRRRARGPRARRDRICADLRRTRTAAARRRAVGGAPPVARRAANAMRWRCCTAPASRRWSRARGRHWCRARPKPNACAPRASCRAPRTASAFARAVRTWQYAAYAHRLPASDEFESLLDDAGAALRLVSRLRPASAGGAHEAAAATLRRRASCC